MTVVDFDNDDHTTIRSEPVIRCERANITNLLKNAYDNAEEKLHVIAVISNPCMFKKRYKLMGEFIERMEKEKDVILYIVELTYEDQNYHVTSSDNPRHLQLHTSVPLWHKENMINLGVKHLLPPNWRSFAWIDADLEFENAMWASDALKLLNGKYDIIQLFSHCLDMDANESTMSVFSGFCYQYAKGKTYSSVRGVNYWHPGYAWACTREFYDKIGGLFQMGILGSADYNMAMALIGQGHRSFASHSNNEFKELILNMQNKATGSLIGYVPGVIRHYFHGSKINRKYSERWKILAKYDYNPLVHIAKDEIGVLIPTEKCPKEFLDDIYQYFLERNEDE